MKVEAVVVIVIMAILLFVSLYMISIYNRIVLSKNNTFRKFAPIDTSIKKYISIVKELSSIVKEDNLNEELNVLKIKLSEAEDNNKKILVLKDANYTINEVFNIYKNNKEVKKLELIYDKYNNKILYAKDIYNKKVIEYNNLLDKFPFSIMTRLLAIEKIDTIDGE